MPSHSADKVKGAFGFLPKLKYLVIGLLVGSLLGVAGHAFFQKYNPKDEPEEAGIVAASVVFERIQSQNELVCASQNYNITEKASHSNTIPFTEIPVPFTENSYWYRYVGTIKASVDLSKAEFAADGKRINVTLDNPGISSNTPDMEKSCVLEEHNNVFNPITIEDFDNFRKQCQEMSESESAEGGIIKEARANAETNIRAMFTAALGEDYKVEFKWRGDEGKEQEAAK